MKTTKKNNVKNIILSGSIIAGSVIGLSALEASATETFRYSELGSGGELRSELLKTVSSGIMTFDMKCGEGKCGEKKAKDKKKDKPGNN